MRGNGKKSARTITAATLLLTSGIAAASPTGGQVVAGAGTISQSGTTTTIRQATQDISLNWNSFNIAPQETVNFVQPSVTSIAVNRIFDVNGTQILGHLDANGQVYLINPNGIVFGKGSRVDVGGLVASTLNLNDPTFGGDVKTFSGSGSGSVVNNGTIDAGSGGYVALLANTVSNRGTISARLGSVALGAGSAATLTFAGNRLVHMQVDQSVLNSLAENSGVIRADGGQVLMTAGAKDALLASVVNNTGVIEANTVENRGGNIALLGGSQAGQVVVKGTLDVSSATGQGGEITATGATVLVGDGARVAATGATGGGSIDIGGGWEGGGGIAQATGVYVSKTATLDASGTGHGNGGDVVVRSNVNDPKSATRVYGTLLARGGAGGGDGGRIETSGHYLDVSGIVADASARAGVAGEWLLDPYNIIIGSSTSGNTLTSGNGQTTPNFSPTSSDSTILASDISTALNGGNTVQITTGTSGSSLGDITVNTAITKTTGGTAKLLLQAADSIIINAPITSSSGILNVNLSADTDGAPASPSAVHDGVGVIILNSSISTNGGYIQFGPNAQMTINGVANTWVGGDVYVGGGSSVTLSTKGGNINLYGQLIIANTGGFNVNTANGSVLFSSTVDSGDTYAYVSASGISWTSALSAAKSGLGANVGDTYLATITSRLENAVAGATASYNPSWLGAERVTGIGTDAIWRWVTGPEGLQNGGKGLTFFTQNGSSTTNGSGGTAIGSAYTNWNAGEPNNFNGANLSASGLSEWVMQFTGSQGQWNDLSPTNTGGILGYVKETNLAPSALSVNAGTGAVTFAAAIGSNKSLSTLAVTANTIALPSSATVNTTGTQTFTTPTGQVSVGGTNVNLLTVSASNLSTTYGLGVPALGTPTYSGFANGDTVASLSTASTQSTTAPAQPNAGSYPITLSTAVDPNYYILYNPGTLIVNLATLNITASSASKTYRGANPALTVGYSGLQYSDTASSVLSTLATASTTATTASNAGTYPTTATGAVASSPNYTIAYVPGTLTVNPAPLTVSGFSGTGRIYNGLTADTLTGTGTLSGLLNGETLTLGNTTSGTLASANAGSEGVTSALTLVSGTGLASNYTLTQPTLANVTIAQAPLTVTGLSGTGRAYNGLTADTLAGTPVLSGLQNSETLTLGNTTSGTLASANAGSEAVTSALTLVSGTGLASNYSLTQPTLAAVTITQAPLTVSGLSGTGRAYNGLTADTLTGTAVLSGLQNSETLSLGNATTGTLASANAGSEALSTAVTLGNGTGGGLAGNYTLTQPTLANVTITQAPLTVTGLAGTGRNYNGSTVDALTGTGALSGLVGSETLTLGNATSGTLASANAGPEPVTTAITLGNGTGGGLAGNYTLTQPSLASVTISPAPLTVTGLAGTGRNYNGSTVDALTGTGVLSGLVGSETLTLGNTTSGTLASANAGSEALSTAITLGTGTGSASNYTLTQPTLANVTIAQAPLTVTGITANNKVYDGGTTATLNNGSAVFAGEIVGDNLTVAADTGSFASKNVATGVGVSITGITLGGTSASNYVLTNTTAGSTADITQLASVVWIGPASGGSWSNPANWAGGAIPDLSNVASVVVPAADTVKFDSSVAGPVNLSNLSSGGLNIAGGTLNVASALNLTDYAQTGGIIGGPGSFTVNGAFSQTAGQINMGPGAVTIDQSQGNLSFASISGGAMNLVSAAGSVTLGALAASGNLSVTSAGGTITQSAGASLNVGGTSTLQASAAGVPADISLTNASNTFAQAVSASGAAISLADAGPLTLGTIGATGDLTLASTGALDLGTSTVGGNLAANSGSGAVTQDGPLAVSGTTDIVAGTGNIGLNNTANTFAQAVSAAGAQIGLADAGPLTLGTVNATGNFTLASTGALDLGSSSVGGNLSITSGNGSVNQNGRLHVSGTTDIVAGTGKIQLNNPSNVLNGKVTTLGGNVAVVGGQTQTTANPLVLNALSQLESLTLVSGAGAQSGAMELSHTFNEAPGTGLNASASSDLTLVKVTRIGANGPNLTVFDGGVHLPKNTMSFDE